MSVWVPGETRREVSLADAFVLREEIDPDLVQPEGSTRGVDW